MKIKVTDVETGMDGQKMSYLILDDNGIEIDEGYIIVPFEASVSDATQLLQDRADILKARLDQAATLKAQITDIVAQ